MKVLHVINNLRREGAQVQLFNQLDAARGDGIEYCVYARQPGGALVDALRTRAVKVAEPAAYAGFGASRASIFFLRELCIENGIDLIHAHMADAAFLGWRAARALGLPLVITHHGQDILLNCNPLCRRVYHLLLALAARYAAVNVAVSAPVAARVQTLLRIGAERVQVIANGVAMPQAERIARRAPGGETSPTLVNVGRLVPLKGQRQLVAAMPRLLEKFPRARLVIVGGGELESELRRLAADQGVAGQVEFTGQVDDVGAHLAAADVFVSASRSEGMPVSVLEAMAWGLPVVASDIPGNRSVVSQRETGLLYRLDDIDDLVATLSAALGDAALAARVAQRARLMVERDYSAASCAQKHAELYRAVGGRA